MNPTLNVLLADALHADCSKRLVANDIHVDEQPSLSAEELGDALAQSKARIVVVRSTKVTADAIGQAPHLEVIIRAGAGINTIDVEAASRHGVYVANTPGQNAIAVAELTMGLALAMDRHIAQADASLKQKQWKKKIFGKAEGLYGKRWGIVGFGPIGQAVAERVRGFGLEPIAWSRSLTAEKAAAMQVGHAETLQALMQNADIVSLHLPKAPETKGLLSAELLGLMQPGATLINVAREGLVDEAALLKHIEAGTIRYATDVFENEPASGNAEFSHAIAQHPAVVCTPHIGASTAQAQQAVAQAVANAALTYQQSGSLPGCVNLIPHPQAPWRLDVRHHNQVGVLAKVLTALEQGGINVEDVDNRLFRGEEAAFAKIRLSHKPNPQTIEHIETGEHVLSVALIHENESR